MKSDEPNEKCENQDCRKHEGAAPKSWEMSRESEGVSNNVEGSFRDRTMHEAICPLVTYGGVCTHPASQVSLSHNDSAEETIRCSRFFLTAQEEGLLKSKTCYSLAICVTAKACHGSALPRWHKHISTMCRKDMPQRQQDWEA